MARILRYCAASALSLLVALAAHADAPAAVKQRVGGFVVTWPDTVDPVPAGTALRVAVRPTSAPARRLARVEVLRLAHAGNAESVILRRKVRRRAVEFRPAAGARYRVRVTVGRRSVQRTVTASAETVASPPNPEPAPMPPMFCGATSPPPSATLTPVSSTAKAGETVSFALVNTGQECFRTGPSFQLRRQDGSDVPLNLPWPALLVFVHPGGTYGSTLQLPADLAPGVYRAVKTVQSGLEESPVSQQVSAEFTVTA